MPDQPVPFAFQPRPAAGLFSNSKPAFRLDTPDAVLLKRLREAKPAPKAKPSRIWELGASLHCSIVGTCLSTGELRQLLVKLGIAGAAAMSDHDLHSHGVGLAANNDIGARLLNKALDKRHHAVVAQFAKAGDSAALRALWQAAVSRGEIPGAYWAVLTHPVATVDLVREVFGQVHMLSHLVGAANRADIRRLCELEEHKTELEAKVTRQQAQLRDALTARDATIRDLQSVVLSQAAGADKTDDSGEIEALRRITADLKQRLDRETARRERVEQRLAAGVDSARDAEIAQSRAEWERDALRAEIALLEARLEGPAQSEAAADLRGLTMLYVGGHPNHVAGLRRATEDRRAGFLHHDGGVEDNMTVLGGLISRADIACFPVDCVSHDAALTVKRLCRQAGKPYLPLRSAGLGSFLAALDRVQPDAVAASF